MHSLLSADFTKCGDIWKLFWLFLWNLATFESRNLTTSDDIFFNIVTSCKSHYEVTFTPSGDIMKTTSSEILSLVVKVNVMWLLQQVAIFTKITNCCKRLKDISPWFWFLPYFLGQKYQAQHFSLKDISTCNISPYFFRIVNLVPKSLSYNEQVVRWVCFSWG